MTATPAQAPDHPALRIASDSRVPRRPIGRGARAIRHTDPARGRAPRRHAVARPPERRLRRGALYAGLIGAILVGTAAIGISSAVPRSLMAPVDYAEAKRAIESDAKLASGKCREDEGQARDLCRAEARADERIRKADLEARYRGTVAAAAEAKLDRAKARFDVARVKCATEHAERRLACLRAARAEKAKAVAEAKLAAST